MTATFMSIAQLETLHQKRFAIALRILRLRESHAGPLSVDDGVRVTCFEKFRAACLDLGFDEACRIALLAGWTNRVFQAIDETCVHLTGGVR